MNRRPGRHDAEAFQQAWESGAPASDEVARLVRAAEALCESAVAAPSPEFRGALRERLMTEARTVLVPDPGASRRTAAQPAVRAATAPRRTTTRGRRRLAGVAAAAVSSLGVVGLVAGSASALPGEVLYPVKRGVENVELALQRTDEGRGTQRLEIASERLREVRSLVADGTAAERSQLPGLLDDFTAQAEQGSAELFDAFGTGGSTAPVDVVNDFAAASAVDLSVMSADVPPEAADAFTSAAATVTDLAGQAARLCGTCASADLSALVSTVRQVVGPAAAAPATEPTAATDAEPSTPAPARTSAPAAVVPSAPPVVKVPVVPAPATTAPPTGLRTVTDPVLGGLLGDEDTEGLVPGLLNGLLGGGR